MADRAVACRPDEVPDPPRRTGIFLFFLVILLGALGFGLWFFADQLGVFDPDTVAEDACAFLADHRS